MARTCGPGGGPKRRVRTTLRKLVKDPRSTTLAVMRNASVKSLPANWRELLTTEVTMLCQLAPLRVVGRTFAGQAIPAPSYTIPVGTPDLVLFDVDTSSLYGARQRRIIDFTLSLCDVQQWPVPNVTVRKIANGNIAVATNLPLRDTFRTLEERDHRHWIDLSGYANVPLLRLDHIEPYTVRRGRARYIGVRTACSTIDSCQCRVLLPKVWHLGWKMHY